MSAAEAARRFLRGRHAGTLATQSVRMPGYPFGSVVPFALDARARPILLISGLAEHTRNLAADPRMSLVVHAYAEDVQAGPRLTLVGEAEPLPDDDPGRERYLRRFPDATRLVALGDFSFHRIVVRKLLFVQGFGRIDWVESDAFAPPASTVADTEGDILEHMNTDHADTLRLYCRALAHTEVQDASAIGVDCDGLDVRADGKFFRFDFDAPATDAGAVRKQLVALAERARSGGA